MTKRKAYRPGDRVLITDDCRDGGAAKGKWGVYEGQFDEKIVGDNGKLLYTIRSPRIRLEDGSVIWGFECWWVTEAIHNEVMARIAAQRQPEPA